MRRSEKKIIEKEAVLIVDDQPEILNALERLLKEEYRTLTASSGESVLEILHNQQVAVILTEPPLHTFSTILQ